MRAHRAILLVASIFSFWSTTVCGFVQFGLIHGSRSFTTTQPVFASRRGKDEEDEEEEKRYQEALAHNKIRTDVKNFLTQRAIQSFIFLLVQCRDPHTVRWMEVSIGE